MSCRSNRNIFYIHNVRRRLSEMSPDLELLKSFIAKYDSVLRGYGYLMVHANCTIRMGAL